MNKVRDHQTRNEKSQMRNNLLGNLAFHHATAIQQNFAQSETLPNATRIGRQARHGGVARAYWRRRRKSFFGCYHGEFVE
jgi:hypothetical protein